MEILQDKYISEDEISRILYNASPNDILSLCNVNTITRNISSRNNFWSQYFNESQDKYRKFMLVLAKKGEIKLFTKLWPFINNNIISEPRILKEMFDIVLFNSHEFFFGYLVTLDQIQMQTINDLDYTENLYLSTLLEQININWQQKNVMKVYYQDSNQRIINSRRINSLFRMSIILNDIDFAQSLVKENAFLLEIIAPYQSMEMVEMLMKSTSVSQQSYATIVAGTIINGNYTLAKKLLKRYRLRHDEVVNITNIVLKSLTQDKYALNFIKKYIINKPSEFNIKTAGSKNVFYELFDNYSESDQISLIFNSFRIFKPYEYVQLITKYMGCITKVEYNSVLNDMIIRGYWHMARIFQEEIIVCD